LTNWKPSSTTSIKIKIYLKTIINSFSNE
jgi:hypothetical protein